MILLLRRVATLHYDGQVFLFCKGKFPGRTKVNERQRPVRLPDQVLRADIPVDYPFPVHGVHRQENRLHQFQGLLLGKGPASLPQRLLQIRPLHIVHHQVGRPVLLQVIPVCHDSLCARKARQQLRFPAEALPSPLIILFVRVLLRNDLRALALRHPRRKKFLDRQKTLLRKVQRDIRDAEAPRADPLSQKIASSKHRKRRQLPSARFTGLPGKPAAGTGLFRILPPAHAAGT